MIIDGIPGAGNSSISPSVVIRPTRSVPIVVNQSAWSGPTAIPNGALPSGSSNALVSPSTVIRPIRSSPLRVNHSAPSLPATMIDGLLPGAPRSCSVGLPVDAHARDLPRVHERHPQRPVRPRGQRVRS